MVVQPVWHGGCDGCNVNVDNNGMELSMVVGGGSLLLLLLVLLLTPPPQETIPQIKHTYVCCVD